MMKKLLMIVALLMPVCAVATDMCARDDIMVMVFDPQVNGTSNGHNATEWRWWTDFAYGRVAGDATCLSAAEGLGRTTGQGAYYGTGDYANTFITADAGLNGVDADGNERKYCWCKMTHPASSRWVFYNANASASACVSLARATAVATSVSTPRCAGACLGRLAFDVTSNIVNV